MENPDSKVIKRKTLMGRISKFDYQGFVKRYLPLLSIWICRLCSIVMAYGYYGYPGFTMLLWVVISFVAPLVGFVKWSSRLYLPIFIGAFFYEYTINIQALLDSATGIFRDIPRLTENNTKVDIHPVEVCGMMTNIIFMIVLASCREDLSKSRNEFKEELFGKMANEKKNVLWHLSFYALKRSHIVLLLTIFLLGMSNINLYYIGLLYFIIRYVSSI